MCLCCHRSSPTCALMLLLDVELEDAYLVLVHAHATALCCQAWHVQLLLHADVQKVM